MTPSRPYLLRAFRDWIVDNNLTPYIVIDATYPEVRVPVQYVDAGKIVLNISPTAAQGLNIDNQIIEFNARFGGAAMHVYAPVAAVLAIYARENGRGMVFSEEEDGGDGGTPPSTPNPPSRKPKLTIVK